ncbi:hypothetical protein FH972_021972 [Carpinus fangiana]|uniref:Lysyl-tRNA synthetase n=1 Tax=Carpinus fangiana TaxID=176857 RepID=A0A5N6KQV8_9ROSI|nr:hypothetical protein FH972_021972 [Carpinus fangiana]
MPRPFVQSLRPYICDACRARSITPSPVFGRLLQPTRHIHSGARLALGSSSQEAKFVDRRIQELGGYDGVAQCFPRWQPPKEGQILSAKAFCADHAELESGDTKVDSHSSVYGRIISRRKASSTLWFLHIESGSASVQVLLNTSVVLQHAASFDEAAVRKARSSLRRGDWVVVSGVPHRTQSGELSVQAWRVPEIVAPSLQPIPENVTNAGFISRNRHVERIIQPSSRDNIILRHKLVSELRRFLTDRDYVEVNTPLLVAEAGGAVARPFETRATEFLDTKLNLRVAPELFLKRLIVGNMDKVFEIGTAFRNEGVDLTHNPEFSICEFYQVMTSLPELIRLTEELFFGLATVAEAARQTLRSVPDARLDIFQGPFKQLDFIPEMENAIRQRIPSWQFPDLSSGAGKDAILSTYAELSLEPPVEANLPRLLDDLASNFLEPLCDLPTWIINHPECMSPLSKSFHAQASTISGLSHRVSARAELFIHGREYVNCYEEENSPLEQRRKFAEQIQLKASIVSGQASAKDAPPPETHGVVDESYVGALEYGMPPTGGWGCGIDRIVMLFSGKTRIADVLPFGTLTNVVALNSSNKPAVTA